MCQYPDLRPPDTASRPGRYSETTEVSTEVSESHDTGNTSSRFERCSARLQVSSRLTVNQELKGSFSGSQTPELHWKLRMPDALVTLAKEQIWTYHPRLETLPRLQHIPLLRTRVEVQLHRVSD